MTPPRFLQKVTVYNKRKELLIKLSDTKPRKFKHWAYLNEAGKAEFGDVFPDGVVPVLSFFPQLGVLGDPSNKPEYFFMVYLGEVTADQLDMIYTKLADRFRVRVAMIDKQVREIGLPLRQSLTSGSGTKVSTWR